jgi:hypothetical protein
VTLTGQVPSGLWGTLHDVTLSGTAVPQAAGLTVLPWGTILALIVEYGAKVVPVVMADLAAGKPFKQILADVIAQFVPVAAEKKPCGGCS